jgi:CelD/BcsL family acetyltransferase involved in cellulose biosynthesis
MLDGSGLGVENLHATGLRITGLRGVPDDSALREQWNALVFETHSPQVFYTYEWARAVQLAYGESLCPLLLLGWDENQRPVGVAALSAPSGGPVSFLCATTGDYCDFVVRERDAALFTALVLETLHRQGYRDIVLTNFPEDSPCYSTLQGATHGFHVYTRTAYWSSRCRLSRIAENGGKLALRRRKMVRRSLRAMGGSAAPVTVGETDWEKVGPRLPDFFRAHVARFLRTERISNLVRPERREFLCDLARLLSPTGWLCLTRMSVGTRTVAWNYGFRFYGTSFWYSPTFVNDLEKYSPGFVLLSKLIEEAAQDPSVETVDLGLGGEAYKEVLANAFRRTMYATLHRSLGKHWKEMARYRAATAISSWPWAERKVRSLRSKSDALKRRLREDGARSTLGWALSQMRRWIFLREEVFFFEGETGRGAFKGQNDVINEQVDVKDRASLRPISYELLADAAMRSDDDEQTLQYLLRSANRLREGKAGGFVLMDTQGVPLHFAWVAEFAGFFLPELNARLEAPSPDAALLFDCWTPVAERSRGHYGRAIALIAEKVRSAGKRPWIFSMANNTASVRGIEKAGFERRYSLVRQRLFNLQRITGQPPVSQEPPPAEVSAPV